MTIKLDTEQRFFFDEALTELHKDLRRPTVDATSAKERFLEKMFKIPGLWETVIKDKIDEDLAALVKKYEPQPR